MSYWLFQVNKLKASRFLTNSTIKLLVVLLVVCLDRIRMDTHILVVTIRALVPYKLRANRNQPRTNLSLSKISKIWWADRSLSHHPITRKCRLVLQSSFPWSNNIIRRKHKLRCRAKVYNNNISPRIRPCKILRLRCLSRCRVRVWWAEELIIRSTNLRANTLKIRWIRVQLRREEKAAKDRASSVNSSLVSYLFAFRFQQFGWTRENKPKFMRLLVRLERMLRMMLILPTLLTKTTTSLFTPQEILRRILSWPMTNLGCLVMKQSNLDVL